MALLNDYFQYFKHLCEHHPMIQHGTEAKGDTFAMIDIEQAMGDLRSKIKSQGVIFRLLKYSTNVGENESRQVKKKVQAGFIILNHYSNRNQGSEGYQIALDQSEQVSDDFIKRIILDSQNGHPLFDYSLDADQNFIVVDMGYAPQDGNYAGWRVLFEFEHDFEVCDDNEAGWLDGATTDY